MVSQMTIEGGVVELPKVAITGIVERLWRDVLIVAVKGTRPLVREANGIYEENGGFQSRSEYREYVSQIKNGDRVMIEVIGEITSGATFDSVKDRLSKVHVTAYLEALEWGTSERLIADAKDALEILANLRKEGFGESWWKDPEKRES